MRPKPKAGPMSTQEAAAPTPWAHIIVFVEHTVRTSSLRSISSASTPPRVISGTFTHRVTTPSPPSARPEPVASKSHY